MTRSIPDLLGRGGVCARNLRERKKRKVGEHETKVLPGPSDDGTAWSASRTFPREHNAAQRRFQTPTGTSSFCWIWLTESAWKTRSPLWSDLNALLNTLYTTQEVDSSDDDGRLAVARRRPRSDDMEARMTPLGRRQGVNLR